ncbi:T9SS type A sorting domain-containing protein [Bernardetia sp. Wsw4-3y2]|uniref:T9SS type A sorting domain-containing protein n=1 Tax=Bernardetia sp. Wsw4-3y2 TaxID=3127471 RepID=UPI0030CEF5A2
MKKKSTILFFMLLLIFFRLKAQNVQNYVITAGSNENLIDGGGWTQIIGSNQLNVASAVTNIGFEVWFMGERFTTFSANTGGVIRFGTNQIVGGANSPGIPANARVCVFGASIEVTADRWRTENNGQVRYKIIGSAPNRILVVDWVNLRMEGSASANTGTSRFQAHIYETASPPTNINGGVVKVVYGRMFIQSHAPTAICGVNTDPFTTSWTGIGYGDSNTQVVYINTDNHPNVAGANRSYGPTLESCNGFGAAPTTITSLNSNSNGSRRFYNYNPPAVIGDETDVNASCLSSNSFILNWTDNATNEVGIVLYRSTDGGVTYTFDRQLPANTTSATIAGLTPSTTYYYQVYAVTEGKLSVLNSVSGTVIVSTLPISANAVYSKMDGVWNTASTWTTNTVPIATDDVIIGCIDPHVVPVNTPAVSNICKTLLIETGSILNFNVGQTLTVKGDVTNKGTINTNGGTLIIEGNLINTVGATVNIGNGTLIVQGNFQNASTAVLNGNTGEFNLAGNFTNAGAFNPNSSTLRFDGNSEQLINHTGTSTYTIPPTATFPTSNTLPLSIPPSGTGGGGGFGIATDTDIGDLTGYDPDDIRAVTFNVPTGNYTGINNLFIDLDHSYNDDIEIYLVSPDNTVFTIAADMGWFGNDYENVIFTMSATNTPPDGYAQPITGSFRPIENWNGYAGTYTGTWSLYIIDDNFGDSGQLNTTSLTLNQSNIPPPIGLQFYNLIMLNTNIGVRTQNTDIVVNNNATWTNGVFRADNDHKIIFPDNSTSTIAINASHADMKVRKIGNDVFHFPVGNDGWGAPIGITAPTNTTDHFTANYVRQVTPFDPFSKEPTIHHVGQCEYWILDRTNGNSNVVVTLSYDEIRSCTVGEENNLKVVRWDGSIWRDHFNGGLIATPYQGVLSAGTVNNFSPFTLGADDEFTILPLTLLSFDAKSFENDAILDWKTTGKNNQEHFEIERSLDSDSFKKIGSIKNPDKRDDQQSTYSFIDKDVGMKNREAYYRLKKINTDGTFSYSDVKKANWSINGSHHQANFIAYPNPFTDNLILELNLIEQENAEIILMDMTGKIIKTISQTFNKGNQKIEFTNLQNLAKGSYLIQLRTSTLQKTFKVVKM